jgi:MFS family permease
VLTVYNVISVLAQTPVGFMTDKLGSRRLLIAALLLGGAAFASFALIPTYPWLFVVMACVGLANAVYHPADYDLLNAAVAPERVGRAFSYHTFSGYVGFGLAPLVLIGVGTTYGLPAAFIASSPQFRCCSRRNSITVRKRCTRKRRPQRTSACANC